jgi:tripartite-type tricarboxylate transporter receptor subunit TctC
MTDLIGGQIQMTVEFASISAPHIQGGKVRALAVAGPVRKPALPDVPTAPEAGLPEFEVVGWNGYFARTGTPPQVIAMLNTALSAAIKAKAFSDYTHSLGSEVGGNTPDEFKAFIERENKRWEKVVREMGIRVE